MTRSEAIDMAVRLATTPAERQMLKWWVDVGSQRARFITRMLASYPHTLREIRAKYREIVAENSMKAMG